MTKYIVTSKRVDFQIRTLSGWILITIRLATGSQLEFKITKREFLSMLKLLVEASNDMR